MLPFFSQQLALLLGEINYDGQDGRLLSICNKKLSYR